MHYPVKFKRFLAIFLAAVFLFTGLGSMSPLPARASVSGLESAFFDALKKYGTVDPDSVEAARYYIDSYDHATVVYGRVASYDLVFIAILGTAKAVRDQNIPKLNVPFKEETCMAPLGLVDAAFSKTNEFLNSSAGSDSRVKAAFDAQTVDARAQANEQLANVIPYWREIPDICHFTFNTHFTKEVDFKKVVTGVSTVIESSYNSFSQGDVVSGVAKLVTIGVNPQIACAIAEATAGPLGKIPGFSALAHGVCSTFAGVIIKGVSAVYNGLSAAADEISDYIKNQPPNMGGQTYFEQFYVPAIPQAVIDYRNNLGAPSAAGLYAACFDYFHSHRMSTASSKETCTSINDNEFYPAFKQQYALEESHKKQVDSLVPTWAKTFREQYFQKCLDDVCKSSIVSLTNQILIFAKSQPAAAIYKGGYFEYMLPLLGSTFDPQGQTVVDNSIARDIKLQQKTTNGGAADWEQLIIASWTPQCSDDLCKSEIKEIALNLRGTLFFTQLGSPGESSIDVLRSVMPDVGKKLDAAIKASDKRKPEMLAAQDSIARGAAPVSTVVPQSRTIVNNVPTAELTAHLATPTPAPPVIYDRKISPSPTASIVQVPVATTLPLARMATPRPMPMPTVSPPSLSLNRSVSATPTITTVLQAPLAVSMSNAPLPVTDSKAAPRPSVTVAEKLHELRCDPFLGRDGEYLCADVNGFTACTSAVRGARATWCLSAATKVRYATVTRAYRDLNLAGCTIDDPRAAPRTFACASPAMVDCDSYRLGGMEIVCVRKESQTTPRR